MTGPIAGIRVLEMANFISGPYAGMLLADLGAEVTKVELPGSGDPFRSWGDREGEDRPQFAAFNRGKKSVTLNVQTKKGKEAYRRLVAKADVVIENFRPGTLDRLGIGYESLQPMNPGLVYCSMPGMGSTGPYRHRPAYDAIAQAMSGLWSVLTDLRKPQAVGPPMSDQLAGVYAAYGILAALVARAADGRGQRIEVSMLSASLAFMTEPIANYLVKGEISDLHSRPHRSQSYAFLAADELPIAVHLSSPPKFWQALTAAVGRPELAEDPRFASKSDRVRNYELLHSVLAETFRTRPRAAWLATLEAHDVPVAPINNVAEVLADPQTQHLDMVRTFGQRERAVRLVGYPVEFAATPCAQSLPPPTLGEHSTEILRQAGYSDEELACMRREGAI